MEKVEIAFDEILVEYETHVVPRPGVIIFYCGSIPKYIGRRSNLIGKITAHLDDQTYAIRLKVLKEVATQIFFYPTDSTEEALLLEYQLVSKYQPELNQLWIRDISNVSSQYIRLTTDEIYPRLLFSKVEMVNSTNLGPYPNEEIVKKIITHLASVYPIADCPYPIGSGELDRWKKKCPRLLNGYCSAPCEKKVPRDIYLQHIDDIIRTMTNDNTGMIDRLKQEMQQHSNDYDFELAKQKKDLIKMYHMLHQSFVLPLLEAV